MKKKLYSLLRIFISFSLIALLLWFMRDKLGQITLAVKNADYTLLFLAFLVHIMAVFVMGLRLSKVLSVQNISLSVKESSYLCFLGYFFNNFFPTSIGGDVVKAYYAGKKFNRKGAAFSGVFMDRLLAMLPFTFLPTCALIFMHKKLDNTMIVVFVIALFLMTLLTIIGLLNKRVALFFHFLIKPFQAKAFYQKITRIYDSLNIYRHHKVILTWSFVLSLISQGVFVTTIFIFARAVGVYDVPLGVFFLLVPLVSIVGMVPSINGLGVVEAAVVYVFKDYMPASTAFTVALLSRASLLGLAIIGASIYAFKKDLYAPPKEELST